MAACTGTVEQETLKLMFSYLVNCINTDGLLPAALSRQLITERQRLECFSEPDPNKKAEKFLSHLQRAVNGDSENFHIFVQLLNESGQGSIASRLKTQGKHNSYKFPFTLYIKLKVIDIFWTNFSSKFDSLNPCTYCFRCPCPKCQQ